MADDFENFLRNTPAPAAGAPAVISPAPGVAPQSAEAITPFESFLKTQKAQQDSQTTQQAQAITVANSTSSPDVAGQASKIGKQIGLPQAAVETDLPRYQAQAKAQQNAQIVAQDPKLAQWVADNPDAARVAQDDYAGMSQIGKLLYGGLQGLGGSTNDAVLAINRAIGSVLKNGAWSDAAQVSDWWYQNMIAPRLEAKQSLDIGPQAPFGVKAAGMAGNLLGMISQITLTGGAGAATEGGVAANTVAQAVGQAAKTGTQSMAFPALTSAINTGSDVYNQTGDMQAAIRASQMSYATTTLGGIVPLGAPGNLAARLAMGFTSGLATGEVSRQAMNLVLPQQQGFDPENALLSGLSGMMLGGIMGHAPLHDGVRQTFAEGMQAETAERGGQTIEQLSQLAQASKLREHDPQAFKEFVRSATEDGNLSNVYVDGKTLQEALHQSQVDPTEVEGLPARLNEAVQTGGDVQIPVEDYATHIAGTDLDKAILPHLKAEEGGMTYAKGQKFYQDAADQMQQRAQDIVKQSQDTEAQNADIKIIGDTLFEQMQATGRYPVDVARASITPVAEFYRTMAERAGMAPAELYEKYPLKIAGEAESGGLHQTERGAFYPDSNTIALLKNADLSTFLHESGHFFLNTLGDLAGRPDAPQQIKDDMQTALGWMGVKGSGIEPLKPGFTRMYHGGNEYTGGSRWLTPEKKYAEGYAKRDGRQGKVFYVDIPETSPHLVKAFDDEGTSYKAPYVHFDAPEEIAKNLREISEGGKSAFENWSEMSLNQQRDMHEKFAKGFETYLMEGKAPTLAMQGLFSRFRSWLTNVYRSIASLGTELTPEVRGVFDRLLASDTAIRETEQARGYFPLDLSKADASEKQQADYAQMGQDATQAAIAEMQTKSIKDMKWASNAKNKVIKAMQREANAQRDLIREEVTKELDNSPIGKAKEFIAAHDIKKTDIGALDLVAEQFGIGSGQELTDGLKQTAAERKAQIAELTDQRMLERHGELTDPAAIDAMANEAVHNEARARFMATGLKLLSKSPVSARELARAATEAADSAIAAKRVKDLNPRQYEVAETKANKEALTQAPKDPSAAVEAQRQALLSNRLAKAARDAVAEVKKIVSAQAKYDKPSIRAKMDPDILEQIDALRERFDFRQKPPEGPTKQQVQLQQWVDAQKDLGYAPLQQADMMDSTVRMHYKEMTVEQLRGFNDTIRSMEQIARERKTVTIEGKKVDLRAVVEDLVGKMQARGDKFTMEELVDRPRAGVDSLFKVGLDRASAFIRSAAAEFKPQQFKANQFDMHEVLGPFAKTIFERVFGANYAKLDMLKGLSNDFKAYGEKLGKDWQKSLNDSVPNTRLLDADLTKEAGEPVYRRLTRGDMLGIARHVGNESNFDKLVKGMDWDPKDVWAFLHDNMTAQDWEATQQTWDAFEKHWPAMVEMNKRLGNTAPDRIEPRPFKTQFEDMRGGYAPVDYDPIRSRLAVRKTDSSAINPAEGLFGKGYYRADTTTNGSLNSRVANYYDRLDLDFHSVERRLHDTIHDLAYREALLDVHKILSNQEFRRQFQLSFGPEQYKSMQQWIGDLANGQNREGQLSKLATILQSSRRAIVANGIALRVSTTLKHGGSAGMKSLGYFSGGGEKYFASRLAAVGTHPTTEIQGAMEKFPEIRARLMQQDRDYRQLTASMFQPESFHAKAERFGHSMVAWSDMMTAVPTAWAAYDRAITEGVPTNRGGTGKPMSDEDAVAYASQIVREAHGSNIESSRSMVMQNNDQAVKMLTTLYGFMNNTLGQNMDMADKLRTNGFSKPEVLSRYIMAMIIPALWAGALHEEKKEGSFFKWVAGSIAGEYAGMVPMVRDAWAAIEGYPSAGVSSYMSALGAIAKPAQDMYKAATGKEVKSPIKDLGNAVGLAIPGAGQIGTTGQYLSDVATNKQQPETPVDWVRGVALGQHK